MYIHNAIEKAYFSIIKIREKLKKWERELKKRIKIKETKIGTPNKELQIKEKCFDAIIYPFPSSSRERKRDRARFNSSVFSRHPISMPLRRTCPTHANGFSRASFLETMFKMSLPYQDDVIEDDERYLSDNDAWWLSTRSCFTWLRFQ